MKRPRVFRCACRRQFEAGVDEDVVWKGCSLSCDCDWCRKNNPYKEG